MPKLYAQTKDNTEDMNEEKNRLEAIVNDLFNKIIQMLVRQESLSVKQADVEKLAQEYSQKSVTTILQKPIKNETNFKQHVGNVFQTAVNALKKELKIHSKPKASHNSEVITAMNNTRLNTKKNSKQQDNSSTLDKRVKSVIDDVTDFLWRDYFRPGALGADVLFRLL